MGLVVASRQGQGKGAATSAVTKPVSSCEPRHAGAPLYRAQRSTQPRSEVERSGGTRKQRGAEAASVEVGEGCQPEGQAAAARSRCASIQCLLLQTAGVRRGEYRCAPRENRLVRTTKLANSHCHT